ncbi:MAG: phosphate ABC transporter permease subunit PstC [Oscillatoriales cyanobacterium RM2_1_1]|nr:phosphate ABC transporter permease subunit PstC [Oscillatoriales cyanobacterium SM2_3_0]NJO44568.1 phosphate ABC transporter permease subunit PstC [Oscillatoriales cyanobacterium RM2_1_1]
MVSPASREIKGGIPQSRTNLDKTIDTSFVGLTQVFAWGVLGVLVLISIPIILQAIPAIQEFGLGFIFDSAWDPVNSRYGAFPMIYGTLITSLIALLIAVPLGLGTAIFLSENFIPPQVRTALTFMVELLAAIPSVVYGLWGIFVLVPFLRPVQMFLFKTLGWIPIFSTPPAGPGTFPAGVVLAIMVLPIITVIARDSLASLPPELRQASLGLGATRWITIFRVLIPAAFSGIIGGVMLGLGRAMGETMAATMIIGNSNRFSPSLFAPGNTIASLLANQFPEASGLQISALMYAALVLFILTLIVNVLAQQIVNRVQSKYE